jgi:hypothetical protein
MRDIEPYLRAGRAPADDVIAVRGGPLTVDKILGHATDEARRHSWKGAPLLAVSVFCTVDGWRVEAILSELLSTRSTYATVTIGELRRAGFGVLASHRSPHFDLVMAEGTPAEAGTLLALLGPSERNPYRRRR